MDKAEIEFEERVIMRVEKVEVKWNDETPVFASDAYLKSQSDEYGWLGGFLRERLVFVLPYVVKQKKMFKYLQFVTATLYLTDQDSAADENQLLAYEREFLNKVVDYAGEQGYDFIAQPTANSIFKTCPDNSFSALFGTYVVDLDVDDDTLWSNVSQKHRNRIRKAKKEDVRIERGLEHADAAYDLMKQTMDRSNRVFQNAAKFQQLIDSMGGNVEVFVALQNGQLQGCAATVFSKYSAYCLYAGSLEHLTNGAMNLLHWEAMQYFKSLGVKRYDFVGARVSPEPGSRLEGIQAFKKKFGAEMKTGYIWKMPIDKRKYNIFNLLLYVKDKGHCDIIDEERARQSHQNDIDDVRLRDVS